MTSGVPSLTLELADSYSFSVESTNDWNELFRFHIFELIKRLIQKLSFWLCGLAFLDQKFRPQVLLIVINVDG